jgi:alkanesulfonate monooxygenase SsuD/methylene tetrahydromethanopterin reductase-like flavin-dependent oxidoreductase (luciferase family)
MTGAWLGFGITARDRSGHEWLAARVEELGYGELWVNDNRAYSGLEAIRQFALGSHTLRLGVGVVSLTERTSGVIIQKVKALQLPPERLTVGVGSGQSRSLQLVRENIAQLRAELPGVSLCVGAVGPRMCELAGGLADAVLFSWAGPERIARHRSLVAAAARTAGRPCPRIAAYVRVAIGAGAESRLDSEIRRYADYGREYEPVGVTVADPAQLPEALEPYRLLLDSCILRALPAGDDVGSWAGAARMCRALMERH